MHAWAAPILVLAALPARGETLLRLDTGFAVGAGYTDNVFLGDDRSAATRYVGALYEELRPQLDAALLLPGAFQVAVSAAAGLRQDDGNGSTRAWTTALSLAGWPGAPVSPRLEVGYEGYVFSLYPGDAYSRWTLRAGADAIAWRRLRLRAGALLARRTFDEPSDVTGESWDELGGEASAEVEWWGRLRAWAGYRGFNRIADGDVADAVLHEARLGTEVDVLPALSVRCGYALLFRDFDSGRFDTMHSATAALDVRVGPYATLTVGYEGLFNRSDATDADFTAHAMSFSLDVHAAWAAEVGGPPRPAEASDGAVTFRCLAPGAKDVALVGDFNGWDAARHRLTDADGDGIWTGDEQLAPGRYVYGCWVDGQVRFPEGAADAVDDGFGGRNAVLVVE